MPSLSVFAVANTVLPAIQVTLAVISLNRLLRLPVKSILLFGDTGMCSGVHLRPRQVPLCARHVAT